MLKTERALKPRRVRRPRRVLRLHPQHVQKPLEFMAAVQGGIAWQPFGSFRHSQSRESEFFLDLVAVVDYA